MHLTRAFFAALMPRGTFQIVGALLSIALPSGAAWQWTNIRSWAATEFMIALPPAMPGWLWIVPPVFIAVVLAAREAKRSACSPNLIFDEPKILSTNLEYSAQVQNNDGTTVEHTGTENVQLANIVVRNNPFNKENGRPAEDAYGTVEFYKEGEEAPFLSIDYPRWTENQKPRLDTTPTYMPKPRFDQNWNFRTLRPNNSRNGIDFVVMCLTKGKFVETHPGEIFGFVGASQEKPIWQNQDFKIPYKKVYARISIHATGMQDPAEEWVILRALSNSLGMTVCSAKSEEWKNWIGIG